LRSEFTEAIPANIPYVCWIQDHMQQLCDRSAGRTVGELDLVIGHAPQLMSSLYEYPLHRFIGTSNLTDDRTYSDDPIPDEDLAPYRCDVSYVSHGSLAPEELVEEIAEGSVPQLRQLLLRFYEAAKRRLDEHGWINSHHLLGLMLDAEVGSGHPPLTPAIWRTRVYPQIARLYDRMFRHQALEWIAEWASSRNRVFALYGAGWETHPMLAKWARGEIESGWPLRCLYQSSAVSLQVNSYSALHQRLLHGVASGGFVLSRCVPADFARTPFMQIRQAIERQDLRNLPQLLDAIRNQPDLQRAAAELHKLTGLAIESNDGPLRVALTRVIRATDGVMDATDDEGLFRILAEGRLLAARSPNDIPGFDQTVFRSRSDLHTLLDRYVDDPKARMELTRQMRCSVVQHDTYDSLARRIIQAFAGTPQ
jgi:hypothetical protein